jgi:hypothetical protein
MSLSQLGNFSGSIIPEVGFVMSVPEPILDTARFIRLHNQISRNVMRAVLLTHHEKRLPGHFAANAKSKYNYQPRTEATQRIKQAKYHHTVELVQSGKTKRAMTGSFPVVRMTGDTSRILIGKIRYRFPFPVSRDAKEPRHISMAQMGKEIAVMTTEEQQEMVEQYAGLYAADLRYSLATKPKLRAAVVGAGFNF